MKNENENEKLFNTLKQLVLNNKDGFTADKKGKLLNLKSGYAVSITNNNNKNLNALISDIIKANKPFMNKYYYGGWFDCESGLYYLDITIKVKGLKNALEIGKAFNQKAIFDFKNLKSINV